MKVVFMGTPEFAVPFLKALIQKHHVVAVCTQPDRPKGPKRMLTPPPVKVVAQKAGIEVLQPKQLRKDKAVLERLAEIQPELIVVVAYGEILKKNVLELPPYGCINVHASLLPKYRGAAPIHWAVVNGEKETGVTIMLMDEGMDTGPILSQKSIPIAPNETAGSLHDKLMEIGPPVMIETIDAHCEDKISPQPQTSEGISKAPMLKKEHGRIDWRKNAEEIERRIRGFNPWPSAFSYLNKSLIKFHKSTTIDSDSGLAPGTVLPYESGFLRVATGKGTLQIDELQRAGKRIVSGKDFLRGFRFDESKPLKFDE